MKEKRVKKKYEIDMCKFAACGKLGKQTLVCDVYCHADLFVANATH